jgi:hypothetical protein
MDAWQYRQVHEKASGCVLVKGVASWPVTTSEHAAGEWLCFGERCRIMAFDDKTTSEQVKKRQAH